MPSDTFEDAFERQHDALADFVHGDTHGYKDLFSRRDDATLANPFGGIARGWDEIVARLDLAVSYYRDGEVVSIDTISSYHSGDLGYAIEIERLRGLIGPGHDGEEVVLRTTTVFRREDSEWKLVHRHADRAADVWSPG